MTGKADAVRRAISRAADGLIAATLAPCCLSCGGVLDAPRAGPMCARCWNDARAADGRYEGALRHVIHAFKYDGRRSLGPPLGALLRERAAALLLDAACAVPVPLYPWRRLRRGFNQASDLARQLHLPVVHALWRVRATAPQTGLSAAARRRNVRGAFRLSPLLSRSARRTFIEDRVVVIVDDVFTTGATLNACADVLRTAGARDVRSVTLARAPLNGVGGHLKRTVAHTGFRGPESAATVLFK